MKPLSFLLVVLILVGGFATPPAMGMKKSMVKMCMMMRHAGKTECPNKNKKDACGTACNFCVLCVAFIVPAKPGIQRNFALISVGYPELAQSKLTDYDPSCWRPPTA